MKKIIHVDNSLFFRKQMGVFLAAEGFEVESFDNGEDASFAVSGGVAMVICGLSLVDMDGKTFIEKIREFFGGPLVVISSSVEKEGEESLLDIGVTAAITKSGSWKDALRPYLKALK